MLQPSEQKTYKTDPKQFCAYIDAGMTLFPCLAFSKVPARKGFLELPFDPEFIPENHNYGVLLKNRYLVIDCDPRAYNPDDKPLSRLLNDLQLPIDIFKQTFAVRTPQNGVHIYFKKPEEILLVNNLKDYPGLEFKTKFIMACGCFIDKTPKGEIIERGYVPLYNSPAKIMKAPQILLTKLLKPEIVQKALDAEIKPDNPVDIHAFVQHCLRVEPAIEGKSGDLRTFQVACAGREFGLSQETTFNTMLKHFNPRCKPIWDEEGLALKVKNAYEYSTRSPQGIKSIQNSFSEPLPGGAATIEEVKIRYQQDGKGILKKSMHNLRMFFEYPVVHQGSEHERSVLSIPPIGSFLRFDQFSKRIIWGKPAPWFKSSNEWDDEDAVMFKLILSEQLNMDFSTELIHEVAITCAAKRAFHPVREYIDECRWDGIHRLDTWLSRYCGAIDNAYSRYVGRKVLVAAIARVFSPGCKFDHVLVMEGAQGVGKSYMWEILASPWFTDAPLHIQDKSAVEVMTGKWVVELAEMDALSKYESQTIKGFLSRTEDRCRMVYQRVAKPFPRQNIFVGSINPEMTGWLKDRTGNRRYWPIATTKIDLKGLKQDRDVLWAEAYKAFQEGEMIHVADQKTANMLREEVDSRMQEDPWFGLIEQYLHEHASDYVVGDEMVVAPADIYTRCVSGSAATFRIPEANRIASILKTLGFEKTKSVVKMGYVYIKKYVSEV